MVADVRVGARKVTQETTNPRAAFWMTARPHPMAFSLPVPMAGRTSMFPRARSTFRERSSRAAPEIEPGTYRARRENNTTRPSSQMTNTSMPAFSRATWSEQERQRGDSNPCGQSPMYFESISLTTRTHSLVEKLPPSPLSCSS